MAQKVCFVNDDDDDDEHSICFLFLSGWHLYDALSIYDALNIYTMQLRMVDWLINVELETIWKEVVAA
jgi:hypothetical protein